MKEYFVKTKAGLYFRHFKEPTPELVASSTSSRNAAAVFKGREDAEMVASIIGGTVETVRK